MGIVKPKHKTLGIMLTDIFLGFCLLFIIVVCIYPFWHVIMYSVSDSSAAMSGGVFLLPRGFSLESYSMLFGTSRIFNAMWNSIRKTVIGTSLAMIVTVLTAYPLSRKDLKGKQFILLFIYFTMLFSGGMIPSYILMKNLGLLDTFWVYVLPGAMSAYNMFIIKNFFESIPASLSESATLDGASPLQTLWWIMLPLSKAALATITLYYVISFWNSYLDGVLYVTSIRLELLQVYVRMLINLAGSIMAVGEVGNLSGRKITEDSIKITVIAISVIPVIVFYLFLQKYFQKGVTVGAVKG